MSEIISGVPRGSLLGPLFFNVSFNDLRNWINRCKFLIFADDVTILRIVESAHDCFAFRADINSTSDRRDAEVWER
jgi:hypothetical protein